jgi:hypothetical protein
VRVHRSSVLTAADAAPFATVNALQMHELMRTWLREHVSPVVAQQVPILYGGARALRRRPSQLQLQLACACQRCVRGLVQPVCNTECLRIPSLRG